MFGQNKENSSLKKNQNWHLTSQNGPLSRHYGTVTRAESSWEAAVCVVCAPCADWTWAVVTFWAMAAAIASGLIRQKRQAREQHLDRPSTNRRRKSPNKNKGLCNGNLVDIFSKVRIFGLRKRRLRRQGVGTLVCKVAALFAYSIVHSVLTSIHPTTGW